MSSVTRRCVSVGWVRRVKVGASGSERTRQVLRQLVASSPSKVSRLCKGNPSEEHAFTQKADERT